MLYIAYGSNMDLDQMDVRCPGAAYVDTVELDGWRLMFKGSLSGNYATVEREPGCKVPALLWEIDEQHEKSLDRYEGFPNFYYKVMVTLPKYGTAMMYVMHDNRKLGLPSRHYYGVLHKAYKLFKFDMKILNEAMDYSAGEPQFKQGRRKLPLDKRRLGRKIYCTKEEYEWMVKKLEDRRFCLGLPPKIHRAKK